MKKILIISPIPFLPADAGNKIRLNRLIEDFQNLGYLVDLFYIEMEKGDKVEMAKKLSGELYVSPYRKSIFSKIKAALRRITMIPYKIDEWYDKSQEEKIKELIKNNNYHAVVSEYVFFSKYLELVQEGTLKIIDTHDLFQDRHLLYLKNNQKPKWFYTSKAEELKGFKRADKIIAIQDKEKEIIEKMGVNNVLVVGFTPKIKVIESRKPQNNNILFIGSGNEINIESFQWFMNEVYPHLKEKKLKYNVVVAGTICKKLPDDERYLKLGILGNIEDAYKESNIVINPMLYGTGLKIKTIEALQHGKVLLTTNIGAEGLEKYSESYIKYKDKEEMIKILSEIFNDEKIIKNQIRLSIKKMKEYKDDNLREIAKVIGE